MKRIAIFSSGNGTNAERIVKYFSQINNIEVSIVLSNNKKANVLQRVKKFKIPTITFTRDEFYGSSKIIKKLIKEKIDLIVLAGFLWLIPEEMIYTFPNRIINIHPSLLPKYGGKGMYGKYVHQAVLKAKEKKSGITIHYVNKKFDEGKIICQFPCKIDSDETPESLSEKIHKLEYKHYVKVIKDILQ